MDEKLIIKKIASFVLGDGALSNTKSYFRLQEDGTERESLNHKKKNSHYYFKQLSIHNDYVDVQREIIETVTKTVTRTYPQHTDSRGYVCKEQTELASKYHPFFTAMRERFYFEGKKQIDPHYLKMFDLETFAYFYLDNGWIDVKQTQTKGEYVRVSLATHAYSYGDVVLFAQALKDKCDFNFDIRRHKQKSGEYKFYLTSSKDNALRFLDKTYKFALPSFYYKYSTERLTPYYCEDDDIV